MFRKRLQLGSGGELSASCMLTIRHATASVITWLQLHWLKAPATRHAIASVVTRVQLQFYKRGCNCKFTSLVATISLHMGSQLQVFIRVAIACYQERTQLQFCKRGRNWEFQKGHTFGTQECKLQKVLSNVILFLIFLCAYQVQRTPKS